MKGFHRKYRTFFYSLCLIATFPASAQVTDSLPSPAADTLKPVFKDSATVDLRTVKISSEGLDDVVSYTAKDSMWFDVTNKQVHLYGEAVVKYTSLSVSAGYILLDYARNEISAQQFPDSTGRLAGLPEFKDGEQQFTAGKLRYNFKTRKGIIYEARTKQEDIYVLGEKAKFIGAVSQDSTSQLKNTIYNKDAILTTCDDPSPHFGIRAKKLKVVPDKLVVTGFSNLEIGGIPTPLVLPFGFYPITKTRKAGLIIPRDFQFGETEGLGFMGMGWYQPISQYMDATFSFDAFTSGRWGVSSRVRYEKKYAFSTNLELRYNNRVSETAQAEKQRFQSYGLSWSQNQSQGAHPTRRFNGSVQIETNRDQNRNRNDFQSVYQNTLRSNLTYSKTFPGRPYSFNAGFSHTQNTQTRRMDISLPNATFTMQRIYPFKRKNPVGKERWYEKISFTYNSRLENTLNTTDTLLFTRKTLESARMGIQHNANTDLAFKLFKYINIAPNLSYDESWYPYRTFKDLIKEDRLVLRPVLEGTDTIGFEVDSARSQFGIDTSYRQWGFYAFRKYNAGLNLNTNLFFTKQFKKGWLRGVRHKMTPSISTGWGPSYTDPNHRYFRMVETDTRPRFNDTLTYSVFDDNIFGKPTLSTARDVALNYSLVNVLEFKYFNARRDTVLKKRIFDNLGFTGNYSLTRDTLKWSPVSTGGLFRLFQGMVQLTWNAQFDPYISDEKGRRINKFAIKEQGRLLRTTRLGFQVNSGISMTQIREMFSKDKNKTGGNTPASNAEQKDDFLGLFNDFRFDHRFSLERVLIPEGYGKTRDTLVVGTNTLSIYGGFQLSSKWNLRLGNIGYDFQSKELVYPDLSITRDLHCWQLSLSWQPTRGTYLFTINTKPGSLDFIKIPYRKTLFD